MTRKGNRKGDVALIVRYTLKRNQPLTPEQIAELDALKDRPIVYDEDCPELSEEALEDLREAVRERDRFLASQGLPPPDPTNRAEVTEEQRRQIDAFWKARLARQREEAAKKRLAQNQ